MLIPKLLQRPQGPPGILLPVSKEDKVEWECLGVAPTISTLLGQILTWGDVDSLQRWRLTPSVGHSMLASLPASVDVNSDRARLPRAVFVSSPSGLRTPYPADSAKSGHPHYSALLIINQQQLLVIPQGVTTFVCVEAVCVPVHACLHVSTCVCVSACMHVCSQRSKWSVFLNHSTLLFFEIESLTEPGFLQS